MRATKNSEKEETSVLHGGFNKIQKNTESESTQLTTGAGQIVRSEGFREAIETDASVSMNLLNQSGESMLSIAKDSMVAAADRVQAAHALAAAVQVQVNMVKALTDVLKLRGK